MARIIIAGKVDCPRYIHAIQVADFLSENLPNIEIHKKEFHGDEWIEFLINLNVSNKWCMKKSPVIWKELLSKTYLIGGLSEFWEYIDDYYGMCTYLDKKEILELCIQNIKSYEEKSAEETERKLKASVVGIFGFNNKLAQLIVPEILTMNCLFQKTAILKIYDPESFRNPQLEEEIKEIVDNYIIINEVPYEIKFPQNLTSFVKGTSIILITEDYSRKETEDRQSWLKRCNLEMSEIADEINDSGRENIKVIFCHLGPICFTATCLARHCDKRKARNIVAVTSQEGLKVLNVTSKMTEIPISRLNAPPVWGFIGLNQFVDASGIAILQDIVQPYKRSIKNIQGSTLPQIRVKKKLSLLWCAVNQSEIDNNITEKCNTYVNMERQPILPLLRATTNLLKLWFSSEGIDQIISLGVISNGSFGIPKGIVFSQPVCLNRKGRWKPCEDLPILKSSYIEIEKCIKDTERIILFLKDYL